MHEHGFFPLAVREVRAETHDAVSIAFEVPDSLKPTFAYASGQFLNVRSIINGKARHRCYSLCSSPHLDEPLRIAVKRVEGGLVSNHLCTAVTAGDIVDVQPPAGSFSPKSLDTDLLLFAGGSGITPLLSILKSALHRGSGRVVLVYANRDERSIIFSGVLAKLISTHPDRLVVLHWLESVQGRPGLAQLRELVRPWAASEVYICGPEPFMQAVEQALDTLGADRSRVHLERFVSLPDEEPEPPANDHRPPGVLQVSMDGEQHSLPWTPNAKMLDTMLAAGLDAPYSCRVGGCSACMCRVTDGEVRMAANQVLDERELAEGWVLACQAYPVSSTVSIEIS